VIGPSKFEFHWEQGSENLSGSRAERAVNLAGLHGTERHPYVHLLAWVDGCSDVRRKIGHTHPDTVPVILQRHDLHSTEHSLLRRSQVLRGDLGALQHNCSVANSQLAHSRYHGRG
jgi:hypothetical protein